MDCSPMLLLNGISIGAPMLPLHRNVVETYDLIASSERGQ
jgi:hypothetical protein